MRHIHDGELHAFLDGALDLLPEGRGEEIRDHLAECPACRERLQDEESIRAEAGSLLGDPDLSSVALPSFEELRQLADAPAPEPVSELEEVAEEVRPHRGLLKGLPLAWAATIILALGVGWMGGQVWDSLPSRTLPGGPVQPSPAEGLPAVDAEAVAVLEESVSQGSPVQEEQERRAEPETIRPEVERTRSEPSEDAPPGALPVAADPGVSAETPAPAPAEVVFQEVLAAEAARRDVSVQSAQDSISASLPGAEPDRSKTTLPQGVIAVTVLRDSIAASRLSPAALMSRAAPITASEEARRQAPPIVGMADAASVETASMAIPGLEVLSTEWEERVPGEKALLIRQLVAPGDTLELRYLGLLLSAEPSPDEARERTSTQVGGSAGRVYANVLSASLPPGWQQVVMERDRGLVVARGPFAEPHLKSLLKRLR